MRERRPLMTTPAASAATTTAATDCGHIQLWAPTTFRLRGIPRQQNDTLAMAELARKSAAPEPWEKVLERLRLRRVDVNRLLSGDGNEVVIIEPAHVPNTKEFDWNVWLAAKRHNVAALAFVTPPLADATAADDAVRSGGFLFVPAAVQEHPCTWVDATDVHKMRVYFKHKPSAPPGTSVPAKRAKTEDARCEW